MYIPEYFSETDKKCLSQLIEENSFEMPITAVDSRPMVSRLPFLYEEEAGLGKLIGQLARANPQWRLLGGENQILVVLQGLHAYISPQWYGSRSSPT